MLICSPSVDLPLFSIFFFFNLSNNVRKASVREVGLFTFFNSFCEIFDVFKETSKKIDSSLVRIQVLVSFFQFLKEKVSRKIS